MIHIRPHYILSAPGPYPPSGFREEIPRDPEISPPRACELSRIGARRASSRARSEVYFSFSRLSRGAAFLEPPGAPALGLGLVSACVCWYLRMVQSKT
jgi:hypothetical protein